VVDQPKESGRFLFEYKGMVILTFLQCPVCKADVTQPWHLSQTGKPRGVPATELSSDAGAITVAMSPVTERTPLLDDHRGRTDS
jgi:hypothetical protein